MTVKNQRSFFVFLGMEALLLLALVLLGATDGLIQYTMPLLLKVQ